MGLAGIVWQERLQQGRLQTSRVAEVIKHPALRFGLNTFDIEPDGHLVADESNDPLDAARLSAGEPAHA